VQESRTSLVAGAQVELRDSSWTVLDVERFEHVTLLTLRGLGVESLGRQRRFLLPFDRAREISNRVRLVHCARPEVLRRAVSAIAGTASWGECWTAATARIDLRAWQLEPATAAVLGATRLLLADEVGLGKTVQAGLIAAELMARGLAHRILVLSPASLRSQWASELSEKFGLVAAVLDQAQLAEMSARLPTGTNPWNTAPLIVSSIDLVKRPEVRSALDEVWFDVLVVDEAHHLTPGTDRSALIADLAARTPWVVLATATPHTGDEAAYRVLQSFGAHGDGSSLVTFRRRAADVGDRLRRRDLWLAVRPTSAERLLLDATSKYYRALERAAGGNGAMRLVASVIARRAASLADAAQRTLERRLALMKGATPEIQERLPWDEGDEADLPLSDHVLGTQGMPDVTEEIAWLERLVALARVAAKDSSKTRILERLIRRTSEPLIVFSEYRDVAIEIARRLSELTSVVVIHGGVAASSRRDRVEAFTGGTARVLVTTDAAGEGLNLQARCRLLVNLELPWNPMRIEQRIGRIDRIGQSQRVRAIHLYHRNSFDELVRSNLDRRRRTAASAVSTSVQLTARPFAFVERDLRRLSKSVSFPSSRTPYNTDMPIGRGRGDLILLFEAAHVDGAGHLIQRSCVGVCVELRAGDSALTKEMVWSLSCHPLVRTCVERALNRRQDDGRRDAAATAEGLERRIRNILSVLESRTDPLFQGSLFDRKAEQEARTRKGHLESLRSHSRRRLQFARDLRSLRSAEPRLAAAWVVG
jgi:superfamily II DNA or RNA helicase